MVFGRKLDLTCISFVAMYYIVLHSLRGLAGYIEHWLRLRRMNGEGKLWLGLRKWSPRWWMENEYN